ncbi:hypothetical protein ACFQ0B_74735 [Nonomuraea thailandensis]
MVCSVALAGSAGRQPPSGSGQGLAKRSPLSGSSTGSPGGSVRVSRVPSQVPTSRYRPHFTPFSDSCATLPQSRPTTSGPSHCGGFDSITTLQSCGPCPPPSSTVMLAV